MKGRHTVASITRASAAQHVMLPYNLCCVVTVLLCEDYARAEDYGVCEVVCKMKAVVGSGEAFKNANSSPRGLQQTVVWPALT